MANGLHIGGAAEGERGLTASAFGFEHWHDFSQIAVVTDQAGIIGVITMFRPLFHGEVRLFGLAQLSAAKVWITAPLTGARS